MKKLALILPLILLLLPAAACNGGQAAALNPIATVTSLTAGEDTPEAVDFTPGGPCIKISSQTAEAPTMNLNFTTVTLDDNNPSSYVSYRDYITSTAGETRVNILRVTTPEWQLESLELYTGEIPAGIEIVETMQWRGPRTIASVLSIAIAGDIEAGEYTLDIYIEIDGQSYGSVACTIQVIE